MLENINFNHYLMIVITLSTVIMIINITLKKKIYVRLQIYFNVYTYFVFKKTHEATLCCDHAIRLDISIFKIHIFTNMT